MDFSKLKSMSGKKSLEALSAELNKISNPESKSDDRFWSPTVDKAGNGYAVIHFLPPPGNEDVPFIRLFNHGFQGPTGLWYIENSLTTVGKNDPVSEFNSKLWNSVTDDEAPERKQVRKQKRRLTFISNILVVSDPAKPENEGKVFLYKYGKKIFDKLNEAMNPQFPDQVAFNPFDLWAGANFKLKIRNADGYRNYDRSEFDKPGALSDDDAYLESVWKQTHSLAAFLEASNFKSYDELQQRLMKVLDEKPVVRAAKAQRAAEEDLPWNPEEPAAPAAKAARAPSLPADDGEEEDESLAFFKNLANK